MQTRQTTCLLDYNIDYYRIRSDDLKILMELRFNIYLTKNSRNKQLFSLLPSNINIPKHCSSKTIILTVSTKIDPCSLCYWHKKKTSFHYLAFRKSKDNLPFTSRLCYKIYQLINRFTNRIKLVIYCPIS